MGAGGQSIQGDAGVPGEEQGVELVVKTIECPRRHAFVDAFVVRPVVGQRRRKDARRAMRHRDPDEAIAICSETVKDWSGGTQIGETLKEFNRLWSRRVLTQGAVVLLITDGLERDDAELLGHETDRLHRSCRRLIWLNPLLRFEGFEPKARGVRAMLPHVDELRAVHNLEAIGDLAKALAAGRSHDADPRRLL